MSWTTLQDWATHLHPDRWSGALIILGIFLIAGALLSRMLKRMIRLVVARDHDNRLDRMAISFLSKVASAFVWLLILMLYAHMIPALDRLATALLASVSVASVVFGLAAQSTLSNFVAGFSLIFYRPFRLGDKLQISAPTGVETGIVEDVSLGYTVLKTYDNRRVIISNSSISSTTMVNLSARELRTMAIIPLSIGYDSDIDAARALILEIAQGMAGIEEIVGCPVTNLGASSVDFSLRVWCADSGVAAGVKNDMLEAVKKRFDAAGIEIPYGYQNLVIKDVPPALEPEERAKGA
ncbi:mechanosensitive ion channel family protein [Thioclava sp. BHET1]|uniref:Small-conductance mechanosensitive channel n=1 Tax=Thioclava dalianensis TaxID=1185766 RepID=A0A074U3U8_9RHOB|nr:mechanosensitive ion channel family protein [Thioclava dalianensis]KEP69297.1 mechanosensitive ion channel protein [Thioclava dalianensis]TMV91612.1 mechanosensitive ion channel family protein [Thioclava sp. BHET1]SFN56083.1 Small-conductance mechanosensitive channel [Thioclava dalianensis]